MTLMWQREKKSTGRAWNTEIAIDWGPQALAWTCPLSTPNPRRPGVFFSIHQKGWFSLFFTGSIRVCWNYVTRVKPGLCFSVAEMPWPLSDMAPESPVGGDCAQKPSIRTEADDGAAYYPKMSKRKSSLTNILGENWPLSVPVARNGRQSAPCAGINVSVSKYKGAAVCLCISLSSCRFHAYWETKDCWERPALQQDKAGQTGKKSKVNNRKK